MEIEHQLSTLLPWLTLWAMQVVLAMTRASGLLLGLPNMTAQGIPRRVQALVIVSISIGLVGVHPTAPTAFGLLDLILRGINEFLYGLGLGFIIQLALAVPRVAGELVGIDMGLSFSAIADPLTQSQSTVSSAMMAQLGIQLFLAAGLDRSVIRALAVSVDTRPLGQGHLTQALLEQLMTLLDHLVQASVSLALPLMGTLFCLKLSMAMLARVAPRLQIFTMAFALSIASGLIMLDAVLPSLVTRTLEQQRTWIQLVVRHAQ